MALTDLDSRGAAGICASLLAQPVADLPLRLSLEPELPLFLWRRTPLHRLRHAGSTQTMDDLFAYALGRDRPATGSSGTAIGPG